MSRMNISNKEDFLIKKIKEDPFYIEELDSPSEELQMIAVKQNGLVIKYIKDPSREVKFEAIRQNPLAIEFIEHSDEELQLEAIKCEIKNKFEDKVAEKTVIEAIIDSGSSVSLCVQQMVVYIEPKNYKYLKNINPIYKDDYQKQKEILKSLKAKIKSERKAKKKRLRQMK